MEQGLKKLKIGDLLFDPWYGFGLITAVDEMQLECHIKFYDKGNEFPIDKEGALLLKNNVYFLINAADLSLDKESIRKKYWEQMYCIF